MKIIFSKLVVSALITVVIIIGGVYVWQQRAIKDSQNDLKQDSATRIPTNQPLVGWKTYSDSQYGIQFKYPLISTTSSIYSDSEKEISLPIAEAGMHTNIDAKALRLVIEPESSTECTGPNKYYNKTNKVVINDIQFTQGIGAEGAAGHGYQYIDYITKKNNVCITMSFVITSFNDLQIPVYTGGQPFIAYDLSKEEPLINQIISTFRFTK